MESINTKNGVYRILCGTRGTLAPEAKALFRQAAALGAACIYADEAYPGKNGGWIPIRKTDYAPDTLLSYNCVGMPLAVSAPLLDACGGPPDGSAESLYRVTLKVLAKAGFVHHIPQVLYYGEQKPGPLPDDRALLRAVTRASGKGMALTGLFPGSTYVRYGLIGRPRLSVIGVCGEQPDALRRTLESIARTSTLAVTSFTVVFGGVPDGRAETYLTALRRNKAARVVIAPKGQNRAELMNLGAKEADGDILAFVDAGVTLGEPDALERLVTHVQRRGVGAAGGRITTLDGRLAHTGLVFGLGAEPVSLFRGARDRTGGTVKNRIAYALRNVSGVAGVLVIRTEIFQAARRFDETFPVAGAEAELCLRLMRAGYYNVYDPLSRFLLPDLPERAQLPDANRQRLNDVFRVFTKGGDPMTGRGAWQRNERPLQGKG